MADEEKKEQEGEEQPKKKGGLKPIIMIALGAILGAAGVVFMGPKPKPVEEHKEPEPKLEYREHPDLIETTFNPRTRSGSRTGQVHFRFVYELDVAHEKDVLKAIKTHWNKAKSRVLTILGARTAKELNTPEGKQELKKILVDELTLTFFPDGEAKVDDILWEKFFIQ